MGKTLKLEGQLVGVYQNEANGFAARFNFHKREGQLVAVYQGEVNGYFARFNFNNHEIEIPCDRETFHGIRFGDAILTLEVHNERPLILEQEI